jgi:hypothetical protein
MSRFLLHPLNSRPRLESVIFRQAIEGQIHSVSTIPSAHIVKLELNLDPHLSLAAGENLGDRAKWYWCDG